MTATSSNGNSDMGGCRIPLIDFSPFLQDTETLTDAQVAVAHQIDAVNRQHGFLALSNFGLTAAERNQVFAESQQLFAQSDEVKRDKIKRVDPVTNTGYSPLYSETLHPARKLENKEAFNMKFPTVTEHRNHFDGCPDTLQPFMEDVLLPKLQRLAARFAVACAVALDLPRDFFARCLQNYSLCTLRMLHYPACHDTEDWSNRSQFVRIGEHTDFGAYTFLMVHPAHGPDGLQIKSVTGNEVEDAAVTADTAWRDVVLPTHPDGVDEPILIVNTGALMARWTNDTWMATAHRVIVPTAEAAGRSRYSLACFIDPDPESLVEVHPSFAKERKIQYEPIKSSDYLAQKLQAMMKKA